MIFLVILHCQWQFLYIFPPACKSHPLTFFGDQDTVLDALTRQTQPCSDSVDGDDRAFTFFDLFRIRSLSERCITKQSKNVQKAVQVTTTTPRPAQLVSEEISHPSPGLSV